MKTSVLALFLVIAGAFANPQVIDDARVARTIEDQILGVIDDIKEIIQRLNLDPLEIDDIHYENQVLPNILEIEAFLQGVSYKGLSNIVVEDLEYVPFINRLTFKVSMPETSLSIGGCGVNIQLLDNLYQAEISGSAAIKGFSLFVELNLNIGILEGISIRTVTVDLYFGAPEINLYIKVLGEDYSESVNSFLQDRIPSILDENRNELNRALEDVVRIIFESRIGKLSSY